MSNGSVITYGIDQLADSLEHRSKLCEYNMEIGKLISNKEMTVVGAAEKIEFSLK